MSMREELFHETWGLKTVRGCFDHRLLNNNKKQQQKASWSETKLKDDFWFPEKPSWEALSIKGYFCQKNCSQICSQMIHYSLHHYIYSHVMEEWITFPYAFTLFLLSIAEGEQISNIELKRERHINIFTQPWNGLSLLVINKSTFTRAGNTDTYWPFFFIPFIVLSLLYLICDPHILAPGIVRRKWGATILNSSPQLIALFMLFNSSPILHIICRTIFSIIICMIVRTDEKANGQRNKHRLVSRWKGRECERRGRKRRENEIE